jgi:hypothetical protein
VNALSQWGFCGPSYVSQSANIDEEEAINLYCERSESQGAKTPIALLKRAGKSLFQALPEASIPAMFTINGRTFAAASKLWEVGVPGGRVSRGDLGGQPDSPTQIIANETQLLVLNRGNLFVLTLSTNVFTPVDMTQLDGLVLQIDFIDGYAVAVLRNSHEFQISNLEDFSTWDALNKTKISYFPDNITSMKVDHREIWFFSGKKTIVYYNAGAGFPPFIPIQNAFIENGADSAFATVQFDNTLAWIGRNERGALVAYRANGYTPQRISTHAVEYAWSQLKTTSDATAYTIQENGHEFWVIRFPSASVSWTYDAATQYWHKRTFWQQTAGAFTADRSTCHTFNFGKHLVGDWASGNIYEVNQQFYDDFGQPIRWLRRSPTISKNNEWVTFPEFELDIEVGLGPQPPLLDGRGNARPPQAFLRWSNDLKTWSPSFTLNCGKAGQYNTRARKVMCGRGRKRVWEVSGSDPVPVRIADAYVGAQPQSL